MSAYPNANDGFPKLSVFTSPQVTTEERVTAVDFVNRVNMLFEEFDTDKIRSLNLPDSSLHHMYGVFSGAEELRVFIEENYPPLIPGVSRHATNHVVDRDEETGGVVVRYHMTLVRHVWPEDAGRVTAKDAVVVANLPGIWMWSTVLDRLKMTDDGWKLYARRIGATVVNKNLTPETAKV